MSAVPKPKRRPKRAKPRKVRKPLARGTPPVRKTRPKPVNRKRKAREFARTYGSRERARWMANQPCSICGKEPTEDAPTQNAHAPGSDAGMSHKSGYRHVYPLCARCHQGMHDHPLRWWNVWWISEGERIQKAWTDFLNWNVAP